MSQYGEDEGGFDDIDEGEDDIDEDDGDYADEETEEVDEQVEEVEEKEPEIEVEAEEETDVEEEEEEEAEVDIDEDLAREVASMSDVDDAIELQRIIEQRKKQLDSEQINKKIRISKYEIAGIIGFRAQQIAEGAPIYVDVKPNMDAIDIAYEEFVKGLMIYTIGRPEPSNKPGKFKYSTYKMEDFLNVFPK